MTDRLPLRARGVDPVSAYIRVANAVSGGMAEKYLGISKAALEKRMLLEHFKQQRDMIQSALVAWRNESDWTRHADR